MAKLTLNDIPSGFFSATAYNTNNGLIETALENTLSRDGTTPNTMGANLDMNSNRITNLPIPLNANEPARLVDVQDAISGNSTATLTTFSPAGNIAATNVQAAIEELDAEKAKLAGDAAQNFSANNLSSAGVVSGVGFSNYLASPPAIGGTVAAAGSFTTLAASSTVSGAGFTTYFASPPAIGGTVAAAGSFTTLNASGLISANGGQIKFPATANPSADVNTFDDYKESTYTPTITADTGTFTTVSASAAYTKKGREVTLHYIITITTNGTAATAIRMTLPHTSSAIGTGLGKETNSTGKVVSAWTTVAATNAMIVNYDNTYPGGNGYSISGTIVYYV